MINQPDASLSTTVRRTGKPTVSVFLRAILIAHGHPELAGLVRPLVVIVGGRLVIDRRPAGVAVVMTRKLIESVRAFPAVLGPNQVAAGV